MKCTPWMVVSMVAIACQTGSSERLSDDCQAWCQNFLSCRKDQAEQELDVRGFMAQCTYVDPAAALAECVRQCPTLVIRDVAPSEECLACGAQAADVCTTQSSCAEVCPDPPRIDRLIDPIELACGSEANPASPPTVCAETTFYGLGLTQSPEPGRDYVGPAIVMDRSPLLLRTPAGMQIRAVLGGLPIANVQVGQAVEVELGDSGCPFGCQERLVLSRPGGTWFYAAWSGARSLTPTLPGLQLTHRVSACHPRGTDCFNAIGLDLVATSSAGERQISAGQQAVLGGLTIAHAIGEARFEVGCTDVPSETVVGAVRRD